ncbi:hypothetical protein SNOG_14557 [Parastagonospora nodorum SN15]|uniref:Uncharacterized protein n=1 Tax=Phaeosphaeria nodorum (strain SN15 / ATCC MYA-4574 / FGSC 10173) TaxID=321614 RepID=Q0U148_PHANO|nr:hypothetical protein SNOG_14557 [Parastagonospora nodorum SN15]EAT78097.2 hypothetical protein SNOG_14557 [Parastagonospora nodorum SN15]
MSLILMRETSGTIILERRAKRLRAETGNDKLVSKLHSGLTPSELFRFSIVRPVKMFFRSQICFFISLYIAITYSYLYILFTTFTAVFTNTYGWKGGVVGLSFTGDRFEEKRLTIYSLGIGSLIGQLVCTYYGNKTAAKHIALGDFKPEHRLYNMAIGGFFMPSLDDLHASNDILGGCFHDTRSECDGCKHGLKVIVCCSDPAQ